jgi:flagellar basal-body rod protein FlgB
MALNDLSILGLLKDRMHWQEARQRVLAENIANADMPRFAPRDLVPMEDRRMQPAVAPVQVAMTNSAHIAGRPFAGGNLAGERREAGWETTPDGNSVVLEEQMMKLTQNQMDHQLATTLYGRGLALLRAAVRSG